MSLPSSPSPLLPACRLAISKAIIAYYQKCTLFLLLSRYPCITPGTSFLVLLFVLPRRPTFSLSPPLLPPPFLSPPFAPSPVVDEASKKEIKDILSKYDKFLVVADCRHREPKKFGGLSARARFQKSYR